jgi:hypothetical protein
MQAGRIFIVPEAQNQGFVADGDNDTIQILELFCRLMHAQINSKKPACVCWPGCLQRFFTDRNLKYL